MRRLTLVLATIASLGVIAYAGWLSTVTSDKSGDGDPNHTTQSDQNGRTGKPGEAPK